MNRFSSTAETRTYQWRCPICGTTRFGVYATSDGFRALNALRTHIRSTDGCGHGPIHELPDDLDCEELTDSICQR